MNVITSITKSAHEGIFNVSEKVIYGGRWVIAPMYTGLLIALAIYTWRFLAELAQLIYAVFHHIEETQLLLGVLSLVDIVMVGNLILMIMIGSYSIFVRKFAFLNGEKPQWLEHISAGSLKIKMGMSLVGVSSIHLLKDFIDAKEVSWDQIYKHGGIHVVFIISTIALAFAERLMHAPAAPHVPEPAPESPHVSTSHH